MALFIGTHHIQLDSTDSTNNYARELLSSQKPTEGTVISATEQRSGRGQMGNGWEAAPGKNLTISLILYPVFLAADKQFFLNMAISLGVKDFCEEVLKEEVRIKWPNDIYYGNKKLAGILIENSISGSSLSSSIAGIGININQESFSPALPNPVSFVQITQQHHSLEELQPLLHNYLEKYYLQLRQGHYNFLDKAYTVALYRYQQTSEFIHKGKRFKGEITGVAKDGKLLVESGGKEHRFMFKEVEYVL
ncbi:MAG: biotin--[acetyl-CoA-carboxylase] ligase [Bacteroidetes bacterium]|nr:biotin--[acetyl-CoA-carboxylase] ligase [Bacteroidota bacterium]